MVATVGRNGVHYGQGVPDPDYGEVGAHDEGTHPHGPDAREDMLNGVRVHGNDTSGGRPLMVDLVDVLVELRMMEYPVRGGGGGWKREGMVKLTQKLVVERESESRSHIETQLGVFTRDSE